MFKKLTALVVGVFASLALVAGIMQGCGGGSGGDFQSVCMKACERAAACTPDAGASDVMTCKTGCSQIHCTNEAAITAKAQECLNMSDCAAADACGQTIPACQIGTGTGGNGGTMGGGGTGGGSGWTCQDDTQNGACACANAPGGPLTACPSKYNSCFTVAGQGSQGCICSTADTLADCTTVIAGLGGTKVATCPP